MGSNVATSSFKELNDVFREWTGSRVPWPEGRTILAVRWMTDKELRNEGWDDRGGGIAIDLNDGSILFASQDDEGNGPGALFAISPKGEAVAVIPPKK